VCCCCFLFVCQQTPLDAAACRDERILAARITNTLTCSLEPESNAADCVHLKDDDVAEQIQKRDDIAGWEGFSQERYPDLVL
jgi:hypothetical protein